MGFKKGLLLVALAAAGATALPGVVSAYQGDPKVQGPNYSEERHQAMTQAFNDEDYQAWKALMAGRGRVTQVINEGNFARFAKAHQLMLEGKVEEAQAIRAELGLGNGNGYHRGR